MSRLQEQLAFYTNIINEIDSKLIKMLYDTTGSTPINYKFEKHSCYWSIYTEEFWNNFLKCTDYTSKKDISVNISEDELICKIFINDDGKDFIYKEMKPMIRFYVCSKKENIPYRIYGASIIFSLPKYAISFFIDRFSVLFSKNKLPDIDFLVCPSKSQCETYFSLKSKKTQLLAELEKFSKDININNTNFVVKNNNFEEEALCTFNLSH